MILLLLVLGFSAAVILGRYLDRTTAMRAARTVPVSARLAEARRIADGESLPGQRERGPVEFG